ncbi:MAG: hypothetical protein ACO39X_06560 [Candidatus Nanopelagicaceae bacterium]
MAAQIGINANDGGLEFGQGLATTTTCDDEVLLTPYSGFVNLSDTSAKFTLDSIEVTGISDACKGNDFILKVYSGTAGTGAQNLTDTASATTVVDFARVSYTQNGNFVEVGGGYVWILADTSTANSAEFEVILDPDDVTAANIVDARQVAKVTLETIKTGE